MKELELLHLLQKKRGFFESILELSELEAELTLSEWISVLEQKKCSSLALKKLIKN